MAMEMSRTEMVRDLAVKGGRGQLLLHGRECVLMAWVHNAGKRDAGQWR